MSDLQEILKRWEPVIGLEVHAQLSTATKMFCGCKNAYGDPSNIHTCPVCLGLPGALPVVNETAVEYALKLGLALECNISRESRFARKNYFYPDLTKGYQISQYEEPLCVGGFVTILSDGGVKEIPLKRIHMEEDAGKSLHSENGDETRVDFNRCGVPLVEIVSEPVMHTPEEAKAYLTRLKQVLQYLDICECNMEEGNLRCDANISLRPRGRSQFGIRTEMKNMNSFRGVERALTFEIQRQAKILERGGEVEQVTLLWNETTQRAEIMRTKEEAHDYRYFPDPDLVPLVISDGQLDAIRKSLVEMPHDKERRLAESYALRFSDAVILASDIHLADYYEEMVRLGADAGEGAKWVMGEMLRILKEESLDAKTFPVEPDRFVELMKLLKERVVNVNTAKAILRKMLKTTQSPASIIGKEGLAQVSDAESLKTVINSILAEHPAEVARYRDGKKALLGFFMGQVMKCTQGKSDPRMVRSLLTESLDQ